MSQTYYLWTSYKGISNKFDNATNTTGQNTANKWINFQLRGANDGNQNYYVGKIGNTTYDWMQVFGDDFLTEGIVPEGRFLIRIYKSGNADPQNLARIGFTWRFGTSGFNNKDGLTQEEKNNFYGDFAISRGFNRTYSIKTSVEYSESSTSEVAKQAEVSINDNGNYTNVNDGELKIRFTRHDENPFEGIGCLFGFMTLPFKTPIYYPYTPDKTSTDYVLKCFFDEDVTDLTSSHFSVTNCTIKETRKITAKEYWVIFQINEPATGEWTTEYTITLIKDNVTAVNDTNKKNRTQSITYTCIQNNGKLIVYNKSGDDQVSTDYGATFQDDDLTDFELDKDSLYASVFIGYKFIAQYSQEIWESPNGYNWTRMKGGPGSGHVGTDFQYATGNSSSKNMVKLVSGKDGSGNNLIIALTEDKKIYYCRDGGYNWFKYDGANNYRERQYGYSGLGQNHGMDILGLTYSKGTWVICGENSKIMYSTDGYNFTDTGINISTAIFRDVIYHVDRFIVVGKKTDHTGYSGYSTDDGITWTMNSTHFPGISSSTSGYGGARMGPFLLATDNSGTVIAISENDTNNLWYSHDSGLNWTGIDKIGTGGYVYDTGDHYRRCTTCIWNGERFLIVWKNYVWNTYFSSSTDGINWTTINTGYGGGGYGYSRWMFSNFFESGESLYSDIDGILNATVAELMEITDISQNYFPANLVPQAWWENLLTNELNIEERKKENDTRRNYLFEKIFEANQSITYFDISTNIINMPENSVKENIRVYKKSNNSFDINLNTNTNFNVDLGYYVSLKNDNDKVNFTNASNDISFNLIRTGTDNDGYATYEIEKTGGTSNFVIDF